MCEVLNRQLKDGRDKPIITCLEFIREYLMKRIVIVQQVISKSISSTTAIPLSTAFFSNCIVQEFQDSLDDEEDTRISQEYLNDMEEEFQERALLAKSKRFFKKGSQRINGAKATDETQHQKCGRKAKYIKVKAKLVVFISGASSSKSLIVKNKVLVAKAYEWDEEDVSFNDNEITELKVLMALSDDEYVVVGKESARNGVNGIVIVQQVISKSIPSTTAIPLSTAFFSNYIVQEFQDSLDDEEDTRSSQEYLNDLEEEFQERALLAKSKRFFKKGSQRFSGVKATDETQHQKCGRKGHFARDCFSKTLIASYSSPFQNTQTKFFNSSQQKPELRPTKDFEAKYIKVKAKLVVLSSGASSSKSSIVKNKGLVAKAYEWDEEDVSFNDNEITKLKVLMALSDDEYVVVGKESARNGVNGSKTRPPMLNKDNYVPCFSRLLRYAKSKPNGKLIYNSITKGPYVRRMILKLGDPNCDVSVAETFHKQTDEELTEKEVKQIEVDDQAIQTILIGLPEDIYSAFDSCETTQEIWLLQVVSIVQIVKTVSIKVNTVMYKLRLLLKSRRFPDQNKTPGPWSARISMWQLFKRLGVKWIKTGAKAGIYGFVAIKSTYYSKSRQSREKSPSMPWKRAQENEFKGASDFIGPARIPLNGPGQPTVS
nr:transposase, mutator type [Tanacetum cinerariifolium]